MFIECNAIYSWGYHFPIAVRLDNGAYLFNKDKYSSSTSKHQTYVRRALHGNIIEGTTQDLKQLSGQQGRCVVVTKEVQPRNIQELQEILKAFLKQRMKRGYTTQARKLAEQIDKITIIEGI